MTALNHAYISRTSHIQRSRLNLVADQMKDSAAPPAREAVPPEDEPLKEAKKRVPMDALDRKPT